MPLNDINIDSVFKYTDKDGFPIHGGVGRWFIPNGRRPGEWMPPIKGRLIPCANGYHLCRIRDLLFWEGPVMWLAEFRGDRLDDADKIVVRQARLIERVDTWNGRIRRLFAADCAEHVLPIFERQFPEDDRPRRAIETARRFALGQATPEELDSARIAGFAAGRMAREAAQIAARNAALAASGAIARAAAKDAAWAAARDVARDATWKVSWDSTWDEALNTEKQWQMERLMQYLRGEIDPVLQPEH